MTHTWSESHLRSIIKSLSWRIWATLTTTIISYFVTGDVKVAFTIGFFEASSKILLYYLHERLWSDFFVIGVKVAPSNDQKSFN